MPIITLTTDFGTRDYTVAAVKGALLSAIESVTIVDITHEIAAYNIVEAAYTLRAAYPNFPKGSMDIIGVKAEKTPLHKHLIVKIKGHFFIGADTGFFMLLAGSDKIEKIISFSHHNAKSIFPTKDVFVKIVKPIDADNDITKIGTSITSVTKYNAINPRISVDNELIGHIIYIDQFGNAVTDISKEVFENSNQNNKYKIKAGGTTIKRIYKNFDAIQDYNLPASKRQKPGVAMAVFNSLNYLEIALYKSNPKHGNAFNLLGLKVGDSIKIIFE